MKSLITKKEEKALKKLLSLAVAPELTLSYNELRGFLYGLAITPDVIQTVEWVPIIFNDEIVPYESEEQARELMSALFSVLNKHIAEFQKNTLVMPFDMDNIKNRDIEKIFEWTSGFEEALAIRPECWEEHEDLTEKEKDHLMNSLVVIEGIVYPDDAADMFDHIPKKELLKLGINPSKDDMEKAMQVQFFMLQALALAVETIQKHAARMEKQRKKKLRKSDNPFGLHNSGIDRTAMCPCGSGKKFNECCSLPERLQPLEANALKKEGKIIKVDFGGSKKRGSQLKKTVQAGGVAIYQVEITLAYTEPQVWRRLQLANSFSLAEFHKILQLTMGWQDTHMHRFQAGRRYFGPQTADDYGDDTVLDESRFTLADLEKDFLQGVVYTYDFGDNWEHVILLEKVMPESEAEHLPIILDGARACPPEDIGGAPMYQEYLHFLAGGGSEDLREMFTSASLQGFEPDAFNKEALNSIFQSVYGKK